MYYVLWVGRRDWLGLLLQRLAVALRVTRGPFVVSRPTTLVGTVSQRRAYSRDISSLVEEGEMGAPKPDQPAHTS
ncbi:hypothetical protein LY76DRAFT_589809 [Colletotrichum caudatum]|nr:hypothetical protein LY76DRAFT_589809 [Colletotrichum caudatum]